MDTFKADLHFLATKTAGLSQNFGIFATKPKSGANLAGLENINVLLVLTGLFCLMVDICQVKYLNNGVEQEHRFIKKITGPMLGFKAFRSAQATLDGIETAHMIRKGQLAGLGSSKYLRQNL